MFGDTFLVLARHLVEDRCEQVWACESKEHEGSNGSTNGINHLHEELLALAKSSGEVEARNWLVQMVQFFEVEQLGDLASWTASFWGWRARTQRSRTPRLSKYQEEKWENYPVPWVRMFVWICVGLCQRNAWGAQAASAVERMQAAPDFQTELWATECRSDCWQSLANL